MTELGYDIGESDSEALDRYGSMAFKDVHPGSWSALLTIANDWYDVAHRERRSRDRLAQQLTEAQAEIERLTAGSSAGVSE